MATLMGHKRTLRRTAKPRKPKVLTEADRAYDAFMAAYRGARCAKCGRMEWARIPTVGHHLLYQSTHPEYKMEEKNILPLCVSCHSGAHNDPDEFTKWLADNRPEVLAWRELHRTHIKKGE